MPINARIKADLISKLKVKHAFELMNIYKGIPLVYKATLLSIDNDVAKFIVEPPSSICLSWEPSTIIMDEKNTITIQGRVVSFDVASGTVALADLAYTDRGFGARTMVRVEPEEPLEVEITKGDQSIMGKVLDVSLTGFGIETHTLGLDPIRMREDVRLTIHLMGKNVYPLGTVISIQQDDGRYRLAVRFAMEVTIPVVIARYITHRRAAIHRELREAYDAAVR